MSYIHHVPGRVRIKCDCFRRPTGHFSDLITTLVERDGVLNVAHNQHAGSLIINYLPEKDQLEQLMAVVGAHQYFPSIETRVINTSQQKRPVKEGLILTAGKMAAGMLLNRGVSRSLDSLIAVLR